MTIGSLKGPDQFSQAPLVQLLPVLSQVENLKSLRPFFYARYEKVNALKEASPAENRTRLQSESLMLLEILDWLKMTPTNE